MDGQNGRSAGARGGVERWPGHSGSEGSTGDIADLRVRIDALDRELVQLMADRCRLATAAGERKRSSGLALVDPPREAAVVRRAAAHAREAGIDEEVVRRVFWWLIELGRRSQGIRPGDALP